MNIEQRRYLEKAIARKTIEVMVDAGYFVSVYDGEAIACKYTQNVDEALAAMMSVDEEHLNVAKLNEAVGPNEKPYRRIGNVFFVYGNDGYDVINDHSISLQPQMDIVEAFVDALEAA
jgi:hypothetical protein